MLRREIRNYPFLFFMSLKSAFEMLKGVILFCNWFNVFLPPMNSPITIDCVGDNSVLLYRLFQEYREPPNKYQQTPAKTPVLIVMQK